LPSNPTVKTHLKIGDQELNGATNRLPPTRTTDDHNHGERIAPEMAVSQPANQFQRAPILVITVPDNKIETRRCRASSNGMISQ
jgi:hypothetical protein